MNSSGNPNYTNNRVLKSNQNIQVYVRVRPLNLREKSMRSNEVVEVATPKEIVVKQPFDSKTTKKFTFDRSFGPDSRQSEVYNIVVAPLIEEVLAGYNCTVFAYGQTGTGKTHTMIGTEVPEMNSSWEDESMVGIIPRALSHLFDELRMMEVEFSMRISYLELYNEELCDLLSTDDTTKIRIFDDSAKKGSIIVQGLEEIPVHSKNDVYKLLEKGKERRKTAATLMNAQSSRSHTVFSILVHIKDNGIDGEEMLKIGKLNLVDLAGSENISKAGNEKGIRTRETVNINQSLLTLGRVITALVERTPHIPYRESKLTRLLQESLGGRTKTSIIATISPGHKDLEETLSTLDYAHRAKNIQNKPEINQKLAKKTVIKEYTEEIDRLKRDLMAARDKNGIYLPEETYVDMQYKMESQNKELNEKMLLVKALKDELASKEQLFNEVSLNLIEKSEELKRTANNLTNTKSELSHTKKVLTKTKRKVEEKNVLVESHAKTEKLLTDQATTLIDVADEASCDTHQLQNTIERRRGVEVENLSTSEAFVYKLTNLLDEQMNKHNSFTTKQNKYNDSLDYEIGNFMFEHYKFSSNFTNKSKSALHHCMESLSGIASCREKHNKNLNNANSKYQTDFNAILNELHDERTNLKSYLEKYFTESTELMNQQSSIVADACSKIVEIDRERSEMLRNYASETCTRLDELKEKIKSDWEQVIVSITNTIDERNKSSRKKIALLEYVIKEMQSFEEDDKKESECLQTLVESSQKISKSMQNTVDIELKTVEKLQEASTDESIKDTITRLESDRIEPVDKFSSTTTCIQNYLTKHASKDTETIANSQKLTESYVHNFNESLRDFQTDAATVEKTLEKKMNETFADSSNLISNETKRLITYQTSIGALNRSLHASVKDYSSAYDQNLAECKSSIYAYKETGVKAYTPTGQTPARKDFTYPRVLAATSPHANIIRRLRIEKDWSDTDTTITEDSEIALPDISSDELGINSTPLNMETSVVESVKLKDIKSGFNCISQLSDQEDKSSLKKNSSAIRYDKENKENCIL